MRTVFECQLPLSKLPPTRTGASLATLDRVSPIPLVKRAIGMRLATEPVLSQEGFVNRWLPVDRVHDLRQVALPVGSVDNDFVVIYLVVSVLVLGEPSQLNTEIFWVPCAELVFILCPRDAEVVSRWIAKVPAMSCRVNCLATSDTSSTWAKDDASVPSGEQRQLPSHRLLLCEYDRSRHVHGARAKKAWQPAPLCVLLPAIEHVYEKASVREAPICRPLGVKWRTTEASVDSVSSRHWRRR